MRGNALMVLQHHAVQAPIGRARIQGMAKKGSICRKHAAARSNAGDNRSQRDRRAGRFCATDEVGRDRAVYLRKYLQYLSRLFAASRRSTGCLWFTYAHRLEAEVPSWIDRETCQKGCKGCRRASVEGPAKRVALGVPLRYYFVAIPSFAIVARSSSLVSMMPSSRWHATSAR